MGTNDGYDCDVIPSALFTTIDCCYKENYLRCPVYNPHRLSECAATRQFIEECYGNWRYSAFVYLWLDNFQNWIKHHENKLFFSRL
jgi:hypothetical protein